MKTVWVMVCFFVNSPTDILIETRLQHETISKCHVASTLHGFDNDDPNECVCVQARQK